MFSIPYFIQTVYINVKFLFVFTLVLSFFLVVMSYVFTPQAMDSLHSATQGTVVSNVFSGNGTLIGFMSNSFYALMAIVLPIVISITQGFTSIPKAKS